jgi:hypothetical protein
VISSGRFRVEVWLYLSIEIGFILVFGQNPPTVVYTIVIQRLSGGSKGLYIIHNAQILMHNYRNGERCFIRIRGRTNLK